MKIKKQKAVLDILSFIEAYHLKNSKWELGQTDTEQKSEGQFVWLSAYFPTTFFPFRVFFFLFAYLVFSRRNWWLEVAIVYKNIESPRFHYGFGWSITFKCYLHTFCESVLFHFNLHFLYWFCLFGNFCLCILFCVLNNLIYVFFHLCLRLLNSSLYFFIFLSFFCHLWLIFSIFQLSYAYFIIFII